MGAIECRLRRKDSRKYIMNLITTKPAETIEPKAGLLFQQKAEKERRDSVLLPAVKEKDKIIKHRLAFAGLYLLTMLMYLRPHEIKPGWFGSFPLIKVVAILTLLVFIISKIIAGERLVSWPLELKMSAVMWVTGLLLIPVAISPADSTQVLFDPFIKALLIMAMMVVLINTRWRLRLFLLSLVGCQLLFSLNAVKNYMTG